MIPSVVIQSTSFDHIPLGTFHLKEPWRSIASRYQAIRSRQGFIYFVDRDGLICGLNSQGRRRCDDPHEPPTASEIRAVEAWIQFNELRPVRTPTLCSYRAKHLAERFVGHYIPNGAAIIAFARLGFIQSVENDSTHELNTMIGVSRMDLRRIEKAHQESYSR